ncbi:MAG: signal peptidase I, partial [Prevotella sp.]|nr:signal peptidase I [Prevotella sp.]
LHSSLRTWLKFLISLAIALLVMVTFRAVGMTIYTINGGGLSPAFEAGDRVLVNRWSYGLRVGGGDNSFFGYGRLWRQPIEKGDILAFEHPTEGDIVICRCKGLPGDTLDVAGETLIVPSLKDCADADYYWLESINKDNPVDSRLLGFVSEEYIIGRVVMIAYSHNPAAPFWNGWRGYRFLLGM